MTKHSPKQTVIVTVTPDELADFELAAFRALREDLALPGFRQGHVPEDVARRHIPAERIFAEAVEQAVAKKGGEQIANVSNIVGKPEVTILKAAPGNPLEFRLTYEVLPEVLLENWKSLRVKQKEPALTDEEVQKTIETIRRSRAKQQRVPRRAAKGDVVEIDFSTRVDGKELPGGASERYPLVLGEGALVPGFEEAIEGMAAGEEKGVRLKFPASWSQKEIANKEGDFTIVVREVRERLLPEVDDEFAKTVGRFSGVEELRQSVREGMLEEKREAERRRVRTEAVEQLGKKIREEEIPDVLIAQEVERMKDEFRESIERHGMAFEDYLSRLPKREEEFAKDWREGALKRVKAALVLRAIAKQEDVQISQEEIETRVQQILKQFQQAAVEGKVDPEAVRSYTESVLRNEKTLKLIEEIVTKVNEQPTIETS